MRKPSPPSRDILLGVHREHDRTTGLGNIAYFQTQFSLFSEEFAILGEPFAMVLIEIPDFHSVSITLANDGADVLLKNIAMRLQKCLRNHDIIARIAEVKFAGLFHLNADNDVINISNNITAQFAQPFRVEIKEIKLAAHIGTGIYPQQGKSYRELFQYITQSML